MRTINWLTRQTQTENFQFTRPIAGGLIGNRGAHKEDARVTSRIPQSGLTTSVPPADEGEEKINEAWCCPDGVEWVPIATRYLYTRVSVLGD